MPTCPSQDWCYQFSWPCSRPLLTLVSECQTLTDTSASVSGGVTASFPWSWYTQGFVCSLQESLFPLGLWKFYNQILLSFRFVLQIKSCRLSVSLVCEIFQARILEWVAISPLQGIFLTQGINPGLLHYWQILYCLSHQGSPLNICMRVCMLSHFSHVWLCDPMDCSSPGSSIHEILQVRILEWFVVPFSRGSSWPKDQTHISFVSCIGRQVLYN